MKTLDENGDIHFGPINRWWRWNILYLLSINQFNMQILRSEWTKESFLYCLDNGRVSYIARVSKDLKLQLIKQKIIFRIKFKIYWTPLCLYRKELSKTAFCWRCNNASLKHVSTMSYTVLTKFWEKIVNDIIIIQTKTKFFKYIILLNCILTTFQ